MFTLQIRFTWKYEMSHFRTIVSSSDSSTREMEDFSWVSSKIVEVFLPESSSLHWFSPQIQLHMLLSQNPANKALVSADSRVSAAPYFFLRVIPFGVITTYNSTKNIKLAVQTCTHSVYDQAQRKTSRVRLLLVQEAVIGLWRHTHVSCTHVFFYKEQANQINFRWIVNTKKTKLKIKNKCLIYPTKLVFITCISQYGRCNANYTVYS